MNILNKEKILELAKAYSDEGKYDKAIREYEKILLADPADLRVKLRMAELYTKRKQINDAIRLYREVANAYTAEGFLLKAVTVFKNVLRLNPAYIEVNEELAQLYDRMGLTSDAVRQYDILATALEQRGMGEKVIEIRRRIIALNSKDGTARIRLAELLQREGKMEEAIDQYEEYAKQVAASGGDKQRLADLYEKILAHRPGNTSLIRRLIDIYEELGDNKKALRWLEMGGEMTESDPRLLKLAAMIYASQNQHETARTKYLKLAELCRESGNIDGALDSYYEILVMLPDEEERLEKKVEELAPGAMAQLAERALKRRQELEAEERRRQEQEDTASEEETDEEDVAAARARRATSPVPAEQSKPSAPVEPVAPPPPPESVTEAAEEEPILPVAPAPAAAERGRADAAYRLGVTYEKMGLAEEARREMEKALQLYRQLTVADETVTARVRELETKIGAQAPARSAGSANASTAAKAATPTPDSGTDASKKKRISYV